VLTTKMPSWYGGVSSDARTAARRSDRRSAQCAAHVRRGGAATRTGLTTRHVGARVPRDAATSIVRVSGCAWRGHRGAGAACATSRRDGALAGNVLLRTCLKANNSNFFNKTAPNLEYKSCRSSYPLPLSKRLYGGFLNRFCRKGFPTLNATQLS
jgi:hypothetical protein